jgi:hypothetical protein
MDLASKIHYPPHSPPHPPFRSPLLHPAITPSSVLGRPVLRPTPSQILGALSWTHGVASMVRWWGVVGNGGAPGVVMWELQAQWHWWRARLLFGPLVPVQLWSRD